MIDYRLGYEEMRAEQWEKAAAAFQRAIDTDPSFEMAYYGLGRAMMPQKKYPQAVVALTSCRDLYQPGGGKAVHHRAGRPALPLRAADGDR